MFPYKNFSNVHAQYAQDKFIAVFDIFPEFE